MIESDYIKSTEACTDFLAGYPLDEEHREKIVELAEFLTEEHTVFNIRLYDGGTSAYALLVLKGDSRTDYVIHIDEGEEYNYLSYDDGRLYFDKLEYDSFGFYTNKLLGIITTRKHTDLIVFELSVCRWN